MNRSLHLFIDTSALNSPPSQPPPMSSMVGHPSVISSSRPLNSPMNTLGSSMNGLASPYSVIAPSLVSPSVSLPSTPSMGFDTLNSPQVRTFTLSCALSGWHQLKAIKSQSSMLHANLAFLSNLGTYTKSSVMKFLMAQADRSLTQSACIHIILYMAQLIGACCISTQWAELAVHPSNTCQHLL